MNIILAGEEDNRPEVIAIVDSEESLQITLKFVQNSAKIGGLAWDFYYVFPIKINETYTGPWGIDDGKSWIEEGVLLANNKWRVTHKDSKSAFSSIISSEE